MRVSVGSRGCAPQHLAARDAATTRAEVGDEFYALFSGSSKKTLRNEGAAPTPRLIVRLLFFA
jgi:hypothetical protein